MKQGECYRCEKEFEDLKACSNCRKAWYCGPWCQEADWGGHRLFCLKPSQLTTADRLARASFADLLPEDHDVLRDYGFLRAQVPISRNMLLGLFQGIFKHGNIDPRVIHQHRLEGTLIKYIENFYEAIPVDARGGYYPWFLKNQHLLAPPMFHEGSSMILFDDTLQQAWWFIGGSATDSLEEIKSRVLSWPEEKRDCLMFLQMLLHPGLRLSPDRPEWLKFGFCGCKSRQEVIKLWVAYLKLVKSVSFDQFFNAYNKSSLAALFSTHGLSITNPFVLDVLNSTSQPTKSVWLLKQFVVGDYQQLVPSIAVDYGFTNCGDDEEAIYDLKQVYRRIFIAANANPLKLHEACTQGKLHQYAKQVIRIDSKLAPLMKNPYPLKDT